MEDRKIKKTVVFFQLLEAITDILNETNEEYQFYKRECDNAVPEQFLQETVAIGLQSTGQVKEKILLIEKYYQCTKEEAVLLYRFTDAYLLCMKNKPENFST